MDLGRGDFQKWGTGVVLNLHNLDKKWYMFCFSLCVKPSTQVIVYLQMPFNWRQQE